MPRKQHVELDLTDDQQAARDHLRARYTDDWPAYARECLTILDRNPTDPAKRRIPLEFNPCQQALWELEQRIGDLRQKMAAASGLGGSRRPIRITILKARKVGVSTYVQGRLNHLCEFTQDTEALVMAHLADAAQNIAEMNRRFFAYFPNVRDPITKLATDVRVPLANLGRNITWEPAHGSKMTIKTAGSGRGGAKGASRSYTYNAMHISEAAWFGDSAELAATLAAGTPDVICFQESTANGRANAFYDSWQRAMYIEDLEQAIADHQPIPETWNGFVRFFWPWFADPHYQLPLTQNEDEHIRMTLDQTEQHLIDEHGLSLEQLKWRRLKIHGECSEQKDFAPEEYFRQEYPSDPSEAFLTTGNAVFDQSRLEAMHQNAQKRGKHEVDKDGRWGRWWRWDEKNWELRDSPWTNAQYVEFSAPAKNHYYVMGIDTAEGLEHGDDSVLAIFDRTGQEFIREAARYIGTDFDEEELAELAYHLGERFNWAFIIGERNPPGNVTMLKLFNMGYPNLYYRDDEELIKPNDPSARRFKVGFKTDLATKPLIVSKAAYNLRGDRIYLRSLRAIEQWQNFSRIDGKLMAPAGKHDDCVLADCMANFAHYDEQAPIVDPNRNPKDQQPNDAPLDAEQATKMRVQKSIERLRKKYAARHERAERWKARRAFAQMIRRQINRSVYD